MNTDTGKMQEYADFLNESATQIARLCTKIEAALELAVQCMDQQSGRAAAQRMTQNLENIKKNVPVIEDASKRLTLSMGHIRNATSVFGR